jgi:serine/threonine-protein kinase SMG1
VSRVPTWPLEQMSPRLAAMSSTQISVPGVAPALTGSTSTIANFGREIKVFFTKTRPKKICLEGDDGQRWDFLVKVRSLPPRPIAVSKLFP